MDISKAICYISKVFTWESLLDVAKLRTYLEKCERVGIKPHGLVTKCDRLITALTYYKKEKVDPKDGSKRSEIQATIERVDGWRKTYRKDNKELRILALAEHLEEEDDGRSVEEIESVLHCQDLWSDFDKLCHVAQTETDIIENSDLTLMTGAIGAILLFESVQRPGAVIGATLDEFRKDKLRDGVWVFTVRDHKTARSGPAQLTLSQEFKARLDAYVSVLRPLCDPFDEVNKLLAVPVGKEVTNLNNLMTRVANHYGIYVPTA